MKNVFKILLIVVSLQAFAGSNQELRIGISQEFENLNPLIAQSLAAVFIWQAAGRSMMTLDPDAKWITQMAKVIPTLENGLAKFTQDKKTITAVWEIRDNAKWGDGKTITCADYKFARDVADNPNVSIGEKEVYTNVKTVTWDEKTPQKCTFTYDKARWDYYQIPQFRPLPKHLEEAVYKKYGNQREGYEKNSLYTKNPTNPGLWSGPYVVSEVKLGAYVALTPNKYFYGPAPKIQKVVVKVIPNTSTLEANLRSGTIDMICSMGLTHDQAVSLDKKFKADGSPYDVLFKPSTTYEHIDMNLTNPVLADVRVRKALLIGINRDEMNKALFDGKQQTAVSFISPMDPWYTADPKIITLYTYSKREAGKLLDEAGWKLSDKDGYRYKDGKKLSLSFMTTAGQRVRENVQTYLQSQWKSIGVEVNLKNEPARVFFGETVRKMKFPALAMFAWIQQPEYTPRSSFHSNQIPTEKNGFSGQNDMGWNNKKVDELIEKLETEFDAKKRIEIAHELTKIYTDEVPAITLYYRSDNAVIPKALKNFKLMGHQFAESNEIENWTY